MVASTRTTALLVSLVGPFSSSKPTLPPSPGATLTPFIHSATAGRPPKSMTTDGATGGLGWTTILRRPHSWPQRDKGRAQRSLGRDRASLATPGLAGWNRGATPSEARLLKSCGTYLRRWEIDGIGFLTFVSGVRMTPEVSPLLQFRYPRRGG